MYPISMRGFAEVSMAAPEKKSAKLRKYKFSKSDESQGRSNYYVKALAAIRHHHHGNSDEVEKLVSELTHASVSDETSRKRAKAAHNLRATIAYISGFGKRQFRVLRGKRLYFVHSDLVVSSQPDLVVEENGKTKLIKFNFGKDDHPGGVVSVMLHTLFEAGFKKGIITNPDQVECIQLNSNSRLVGPKRGFGTSDPLIRMANELIAIWPSA